MEELTPWQLLMFREFFSNLSLTILIFLLGRNQLIIMRFSVILAAVMLYLVLVSVVLGADSTTTTLPRTSTTLPKTTTTIVGDPECELLGYRCVQACIPENTVNKQCPSGKVCCQKTTSTTTDSKCKDSDGGKNYYVLGKTYDYIKFFPENPAMDKCEGSVLSEYYCRQDGYVDNVKFNCPNGCRNGVCGIETSTTTLPCKDSDGGINIYEKGDCFDKSKPRSDSCVNSKNLREYYCKNNKCNQKVITCGSQCLLKEGRCQPTIITVSSNNQIPQVNAAIVRVLKVLGFKIE